MDPDTELILVGHSKRICYFSYIALMPTSCISG